MEALAGAPALLALVVCLVASPGRAFLDIYLPVLLLIPIDLVWNLPGLPDLTFHNAAILPIAAMLCLSPAHRWRWSLSDGLVLLFAAFICASEQQARGATEMQDLAVDMTFLVVMPYAVTKLLIAEAGFAVKLAKRVVILTFVVTLLSAWQFRMGSNPFFNDFWVTMFPEGELPDTTYRFGFARITGPYGHSILAGIVLGAGLLLQLWLHASRSWSSRLVSWGLLAGVSVGCLMTLSRGPWLGLIAGAGLAVFGMVRSRGRLVGAAFLALLLLGPPLGYAFVNYVSVDRSRAGDKLQENAAYRAELIDHYVPVVMKRPTLGWGRLMWPKKRSILSIDNAYLLMALNHGLLSVGTFVLLVLWIAWRLTWAGARAPPRSARTRLAFTLLGLLVCIMFSISTVWLGNQTQPLLFLLAGASEGFIVGGTQRSTAVVRRQTRQPTLPFRRVLT